MSMLPEKLTRMVEEALAERGPLTLTFYEVRELAYATGIYDPHELHEPVAAHEDGEGS